MALLMDAGSEPLTESEKADLDAIAAIKESTAIELKEKGNQCVKMGKKHYSDAIDCYTKAINQKALSHYDHSLLYSNRAHVNLLLGNYRRSLTDSQEAIKLCPTNVKAFYRASKAALSLNMLSEAKIYCGNGLEHDPNNEELKKLQNQIDLRKLEHEQREAKVSQAIKEAKELLSALECRGYKMGKAMFRELTGLRKPMLDKNNILHWPVLLLYAEVMSSDFIEDFCEIDMFSAHLDMMFSESSPSLPWDEEHNYTREAVEVYYEADSSACLAKAKILHYLLEGTAASTVEGIEDEERDAIEVSKHVVSSKGGSSKWLKVNEKQTLHDVLRKPNFVIQEIPVFYVVSKRSDFYEKFKAGKWSPLP